VQPDDLAVLRRGQHRGRAAAPRSAVDRPSQSTAVSAGSRWM